MKEIFMAGDPALWEKWKVKLGFIPIKDCRCALCGRAVIVSQNIDVKNYTVVCIWCGMKRFPAITGKLNAELNQN